jgi:phosphoribosylpyrophosphate synthetase
MEHVYLTGAESVKDAGHTISAAADTMRRAAADMEYALQTHQRFLDDWLSRLQDALENHMAGQVRSRSCRS